MVFTRFDRDAFHMFTDSDDAADKIYTQAANTLGYANVEDKKGKSTSVFGDLNNTVGTETKKLSDQGAGWRPLSASEWESVQQHKVSGEDQYRKVTPRYSDEIMPFDVTITMKNEYGQAARFTIHGVEILNEGSGMGIDDVTNEQACTFVARSLSQLKQM